jgi:glycerophosphoryl diester phosphodiesterase
MSPVVTAMHRRMVRVASCLCLASLLTLLCACSAKAPLLCAHRGSIHQGLPDNSLAAIREAVNQQVPHLEVDVRMSDEGELFLFHDKRVSEDNSTGNASLRGRVVESLSQKERNSIYLPGDEEEHIPLLRDALLSVAPSQSRLQLDIKHESPEIIEAIVRESEAVGALSAIIIQYKDLQLLAAMKVRYPDIHALARCRNMDDVTIALTAGADSIELERWISSEAIERIHLSGRRVLVNISGSLWDTRLIRWYLASQDVDIIMTDNPMESLL